MFLSRHVDIAAALEHGDLVAAVDAVELPVGLDRDLGDLAGRRGDGKGLGAETVVGHAGIAVMDLCRGQRHILAADVEAERHRAGIQRAGKDAGRHGHADLIGIERRDAPVHHQVDAETVLRREAALAQRDAVNGLRRGLRRRDRRGNGRGGRRGCGRLFRDGGRHLGLRRDQHGRGLRRDDDGELVDGLDRRARPGRVAVLRRVAADKPRGHDRRDKKKNDDKKHRFDFSGIHRHPPLGESLYGQIIYNISP